MQSSPYDLRQLDEDTVRCLPEEALRHLTLTLLADLMDPLVRLAQNLPIITRPPSSHAPLDCYSPVQEPVPAVAATPDGPSDVAPASQFRRRGGTTRSRREGQGGK